MSTGPEFTLVEEPFIDQLKSMDWEYTEGNAAQTGQASSPVPTNPADSFRDSFREVLLLDDLKNAFIRINRDDSGHPWLDEGRLSTAISALQRISSVKLMEANQEATELLQTGVSVEGLPGWDGGRNQTVQFIDWDNPENNTFRVINQFRVDEPGGQAHKFIVPDLVLFVNGIPLVVVECKSPYLSAPMEDAIEQLQRYSNQRDWLDGTEGNERLFHTNQIMVATYSKVAMFGTIGAKAIHYRAWKDTSPVPMAEVAETLGKDSLSSQETLVAGMLRPAHLLDLVRHFTVFKTDLGKTIKIMGRYQQFRAVQSAIERLHTGKTREQDGEYDKRGGIIWHTQGAGKSLTMVFLVRKIRTTPELRRYKVVVVTDRKDLQKQLSDTAELTGDTVKVAKKIAKVKELLAVKGPGLVFAMIQKYQERDVDPEDYLDGDKAISDRQVDVGEFPVLNEDESILVMVDEAHRSHASALHGNLLKALPNCARIGFTGTPIIMGKRKRTWEIFGKLIDRYTIKQSEEDGATVPILYEGRTAEGALADGRGLDELFEDMFREWTTEELERIKKKYATKGDVMEAKALISAKAKDMLRHYVENILPNNFKAQVVVVSRRAAIRYQTAFVSARDELITEVEALDPKLISLADDEMADMPHRTQFLVRAHRQLNALGKLEFAAIISAHHNDPPDWKDWTDRAKLDARVAAFKRPFPTPEKADPEKTSWLGFIIVKSMLLTGFDAPVEQAMYLDRHIKQAELLQAIARVNRTCGAEKQAGLVVDYYGVARHLKEALAVYAEEDIEGALQSIQDEIPKLRDRHHRVVDIFVGRDVVLSDIEGCVRLLRDEKLRAEFQVKLKALLATLDLVLPRPEGLPYVKDAKQLGRIQNDTRNRYRGGERPIGAEVGAKVRKLIDDHLISLGIDPKIPPIAVTDADFDTHVEKHRSDEAKASEMEHAARYQIRKHLDEDPEHYEKLSERLKNILTALEGNWEAQVEALRKLIEEMRKGRQEDDSGLNPETQAPFLGVLRQEVAGKRDLTAKELVKLAELTVELVEHIRQEIRVVGFWSKTQAQTALRNWVFQTLDCHDIVPFERLDEVSDRLVELAKVNHDKLVQ